jgi:TolB protein
MTASTTSHASRAAEGRRPFDAGTRHRSTSRVPGASSSLSGADAARTRRIPMTTYRRTTTMTLLLTAGLLAAGTGPVHAAAEPVPTMAFTSDRDGDDEIVVRTADGRLRQLTTNRAHDYGALWSPDGRRLAFVSTRDGDREIFVMNADGSGLRQLTRNSKTADGSPINDQAPAWSPDGRMLAFVSTRDGGEPEIYRMNADGTNQMRLTRTPAYVSNHTPSWSPDGHHLVFSSDRVHYDNYEVYRMRANGTELVRMTRTANGVDDNAPEYSPDGHRIAFSSTRNGNQHDLFTMSSAGTDVRRLGGHATLDDVFPKWAPDGRSLLFGTFAGPNNTPSEDVWAIDSDGTDRRLVMGTRADEGMPDPRPRS